MVEETPKHGEKPSKPNAPGQTGNNENIGKSAGNQEPTTETHVDNDVIMGTGEAAGQTQGNRGNIPPPVTSQLADTITENVRSDEEVQRLKAALDEMRRDRDHARSESRALRLLRDDSKELLDSLEDRVTKLKAENTRLRKEQDEAKGRYECAMDEKEDWRLKLLEYEETLADLREEIEERERYPTRPTAPTREPVRVPAAPQRPSTHDEDEEREFIAMYVPKPTSQLVRGPPITQTGNTARPDAPRVKPFADPGQNTTTIPSRGPLANQPQKPGAKMPPPGPGKPGRPVLPALGKPVLEPPPIQFGSIDDPAGLESSDWATDAHRDAQTGEKRKTMESPYTDQSYDGRYAPAPRGGFGMFRPRGGTRGRSSATRRAMQSATQDNFEFTGRWYVNITDPDGAEAWRQRDAQQIHQLVSGSNRTQVDPNLQETQRLLIHNARLVPCEHRSAAQTEVVDFAIWAETMGNHPLMQRDQVSPGVRRGQHGTISFVDMSVQSFMRELRPTVGRMRDHTSRIGRVTGVARDMFSRPGAYERLVSIIAPNASDDIYSDPVDQTVLTEANRLTSAHFPTVAGIDALSVATYFWTVLRVPRSVVRHVIEPYFRRMHRHAAASRAFERLVNDPSTPDDATAWLQEQGQPRARGDLIVRNNAAFYAVRESARVVWANSATRGWRWILPPPNVGPAARTAMETLQEDVSFRQVELSLDWVPENVRGLFEGQMRAEVEAWESSDVMSGGQDEEMDAEDGQGAS